MTDCRETMVIVSGSNSDWAALAAHFIESYCDNIICYVNASCEITAPLDYKEIQQVDFYIIHEDAENILDLVNTILERNMDRKIYVAVHDSNAALNFPKFNEVKDCLKAAKRGDIRPVRFYHESESALWNEELEPFIKCITVSGNVGKAYTGLLNKIRALTADEERGAVIERARMLRHEILRVFFRFNLESELRAKTVEEKEARIEGIKQLIAKGDLDGKLDMLIEISGEDHPEFKKRLTALKELYIGPRHNGIEALMNELDFFAEQVNILVETTERVNKSVSS